ncbi:MAG: cbb3-type cytochrome c oxidase N-terminal domain-containing protein [Rubricoccaceae bacterium]|nr:cbb3-type cytochrome c oxidase N-terminal domain-containing protein [Rubricoccaceae bacterium]
MNTPTQSEKAPNKAPESSDRAIQGHKYDGIREYDNPMPGWWVWLFIATIVFSPIYALGLHQFDFIDSYEENLAESQAELAEIREVYETTGPSFKTDPGALREYAADPLMTVAGSETYTTLCAACHGDQGQGLIGPNLTDEFWINGGSPEDIFLNIAEGVPANGMPAWNTSLSDEEIAQVMSYVISLEGTNPPNPKPPQGEPYSGQ